MRSTLASGLLAACLALTGCSDDEGTVSEIDEEPNLGFEILHSLSPTEIVVWLSLDGLTLEEFEAIELDGGWFKNQPREGDPDGGRFFRSPSASADGEFTDEEHYGHLWRHVATVTQTNQQLDGDGHLRGNTIVKHHEVTFNAGRVLPVLVSPEGESYVRITRDAGRTSDTPTIPADWTLTEHETTEELVVRLPDETLNIRADNEDSFQGPVTQLNSARD